MKVFARSSIHRKRNAGKDSAFFKKDTVKGTFFELPGSTSFFPSLSNIAERRGTIPSNTVHCLMKWTYCHAPYSPGSWAARVTYHCPRFIFPGIILPGTTESSYITIPDEFIGYGPRGGRLYRCRPRPQTLTLLTAADALAASLNRMILYPDFVTCHAGFRKILTRLLDAAFAPSVGGSPGIRVNASFPGAGFPC